MWIGLFYSRSTARFFHTDPSLPCMEDNDGAELANGMIPAMALSEIKTSSSDLAPSKIPESEVLDHSNGGKKDAHLSNQRPEVLDLSMKKSSIDLTSDRKRSRKETPVSHEESGTVKDLPVHKTASGLQNETSLNPRRSTEVELKVCKHDVNIQKRGLKMLLIT